MKIRRITVAVLIILTLLLIAEVRSSVRFFRQSSIHFEIGPNKSALQWEKTQEFHRPQGELTSLVISSQNGKVEVQTAKGTDLVVSARVSAASEKQLQGWEVEEQVVGSEIKYELRGSTNEGKVLVTYLVEVPPGMEVTISQRYGAVGIRDFIGYLDIDARFSQVVVNGLQGSASISGEFGSVDVQRMAGPLILEESYSTSKIGLVEVEDGYNFQVDITNGALTGNAPVQITTFKNTHQARGSSGAGLHPIIIKSSFGSVNLNLNE